MLAKAAFLCPFTFFDRAPRTSRFPRADVFAALREAFGDLFGARLGVAVLRRRAVDFFAVVFLVVVRFFAVVFFAPLFRFRVAAPFFAALLRAAAFRFLVAAAFFAAADLFSADDFPARRRFFAGFAPARRFAVVFTFRRTPARFLVLVAMITPSL